MVPITAPAIFPPLEWDVEDVLFKTRSIRISALPGKARTFGRDLVLERRMGEETILRRRIRNWWTRLKQRLDRGQTR